MRSQFPDIVEKGRVIRADGPLGTKPGTPYGAFILRCEGVYLTVMASNGSDWKRCGLDGPAWEHVSVSNLQRCPTWSEMCWVKGLFFEPHEVVVQFHPAEAEYVNHHPTCLHLWRCPGVAFPMPPAICVGPKQEKA